MQFVVKEIQQVILSAVIAALTKKILMRLNHMNMALNMLMMTMICYKKNKGNSLISVAFLCI